MVIIFYTCLSTLGLKFYVRMMIGWKNCSDNFRYILDVKPLEVDVRYINKIMTIIEKP